jgi:hypothetical protein
MPEPTNEPKLTTPDPLELIQTNPRFAEEVGKLVQAVANHQIREVHSQLTQASHQAVVEMLKKEVVRRELNGMDRLASLLPDTADLGVMTREAEKLRGTLGMLFGPRLHPDRTQIEPNAVDLIELGLRNRNPPLQPMRP